MKGEKIKENPEPGFDLEGKTPEENAKLAKSSKKEA
jgi:hypothetical protein